MRIKKKKMGREGWESSGEFRWRVEEGLDYTVVAFLYSMEHWRFFLPL